MSTQREGVNPLRPYYIPPSIGEPAETVNKSSPSPNPFPDGRHVTAAGERYASKARDILSDLEYNDYLGDTSPSMVQNVKDLIDELIWKYSSVLMAQPFEVAKTLLQVRNQDENAVYGLPEVPVTPKKLVPPPRSSMYYVSVFRALNELHR